MNNFKRYLLALSGASLLWGAQSCKKEENDMGVPYYKFTDDELQWLSPKKGDEWVFETSSGKRQSYVVFSINDEFKKSYIPSNFGGIIRATPSVKYYYDAVKIDIKRIDTLGYNYLEFKKTIPVGADPDSPPHQNGQFKFGGLWMNYTGGWQYEEIFGNLNIYSNQLLPQNSSTIEINGRSYTRVITISSNQGNTFSIEKPYINTIYYAQREGVIRMISAKGEIWDRIP